jgi:hypothetical protein
MKIWEVMRLLEENPAKVYEARLARNPWVARVLVEKGCYKFTGHDGNDGDQIIQPLVEERMTLDLDWYEVKQPVPWQEAIQAWADGKKVSYKYPDDEVMYPFQNSNQMVTVEKIKTADWYVED